MFSNGMADEACLSADKAKRLDALRLLKIPAALCYKLSSLLKTNMSEQKVKDWPAEERPRERLIKYGAETLSNAHLLAIILRTGGGGRGVMTLARHLMEEFKELKSLESASWKDLSSVNGMGIAKIAQLRAAFELGKRMMQESSDAGPVFSSSQSVYTYFAPRVKNLKKEFFYCTLLDAKNRLISEPEKVSEGTLTNSIIHPREAFRKAIRESAAAVIFVHNHPSGDPEPSRDDVAVTERLKAAGNVVGIQVLDHIIIGEGRYVSLKEKGIL
jgi:DNA repair protein RadC